MRTKVNDPIRVFVNLKPESPIPVDPSLPQIISFIIFPAMKTWVTEVSRQEIDLFDEGPLNLPRGFRERDNCAPRALNVHGLLIRFLALDVGVFLVFKNRAISSPFLNGP